MAEKVTWWKSKSVLCGIVIFICGGLKAVGVDIPVEVILGLLGLEGGFIRLGMK